MKQLADAFPGGFDGSLGCFSQQSFELGEDLLNRIEVGRVGWQEQQSGTNRTDRGPDRLSFVACEIVDDHDVARLKRWQKDLLDVDPEALAVDGSFEDPRRIDAVMAECCQKGHGLPVAVRDFRIEPLAARAPAAQRRHVGLGPSLVDEDKAFWINARLIFLPAGAVTGDVRPILLAWQQAFF